MRLRPPSKDARLTQQTPKEITMHKAFIIALALTSLGALTTPAFASKKCHSMLSHCLYKSNHCTDKKDCQIECLDEYNYCTMNHDMSHSPVE
jgi:hypothetical protein